MPNTKLSPEVVAARMAEWRNLKILHARDRAQIDELKAQNQQLKTQLAELSAKFDTVVATQAARIEELEIMVFGRKPSGGAPSSTKPKSLNRPRSKSSYRRPIPPENAVTSEKYHETNACHRCGHELTDKIEAIRYEEDIILATLTPGAPTTTVTKHTVESGWCSRCGQYSSAKDLRGQVVTLGPVVRSFIVYLVIQARLSFSQARALLWQVHHFKVTDGEIAVVLAERRTAYLSMYEQLKTNIRSGPAHLDETSYPIQSEQGAGYAWVLAGADGTKAEHDVVFHLADSRGKGNVETLVGKEYRQTGITDRYGGYKHAFVNGKHQICWAHLHRNARDISKLECLTDEVRAHATHFYGELAGIYKTVRTVWAEPYTQDARSRQTDELLKRVTDLCQSHALDPKKLQDLKAGILEYKDCLLVCLTESNVSPDNNKAERALRKLVLKRKNSFGVRSPKGARVMEVLLSVCQSLCNRDSGSMLMQLHAIGG